MHWVFRSLWKPPGSAWRKPGDPSWGRLGSGPWVVFRAFFGPLQTLPQKPLLMAIRRCTPPRSITAASVAVATNRQPLEPIGWPTRALVELLPT